MNEDDRKDSFHLVDAVRVAVNNNIIVSPKRGSSKKTTVEQPKQDADEHQVHQDTGNIVNEERDEDIVMSGEDSDTDNQIQVDDIMKKGNPSEQPLNQDMKVKTWSESEDDEVGKEDEVDEIQAKAKYFEQNRFIQMKDGSTVNARSSEGRAKLVEQETKHAKDHGKLQRSLSDPLVEVTSNGMMSLGEVQKTVMIEDVEGALLDDVNIEDEVADVNKSQAESWSDNDDDLDEVKNPNSLGAENVMESGNNHLTIRIGSSESNDSGIAAELMTATEPATTPFHDFQTPNSKFNITSPLVRPFTISPNTFMEAGLTPATSAKKSGLLFYSPLQTPILKNPHRNSTTPSPAGLIMSTDPTLAGQYNQQEDYYAYDQAYALPPYPWVQYVTEDGWPYYFNPETNESTWDYPNAVPAVDPYYSVENDQQQPTTPYKEVRFAMENNSIHNQSDENTYKSGDQESAELAPQVQVDNSNQSALSGVNSLDNSTTDSLVRKVEAFHLELEEYKNQVAIPPSPIPRNPEESQYSDMTPSIDGANIIIGSESVSFGYSPNSPSSFLKQTQQSGHDYRHSSSSVSSTSSLGLNIHQSTTTLNHKDKRGNNVLHVSAKMCMVRGIEMLLTNGADPNGLDMDGMTPLHVVCKQLPSKSQSECIAVLLKHGADVNFVDPFGNTPLHVLLLNGQNCNLLSEKTGAGKGLEEQYLVDQLNSVTELLHANVDVNIENNDGDHPLLIATKLGLLACMEAILNAISGIKTSSTISDLSTSTLKFDKHNDADVEEVNNSPVRRIQSFTKEDSGVLMKKKKSPTKASSFTIDKKISPTRASRHKHPSKSHHISSSDEEMDYGNKNSRHKPQQAKNISYKDGLKDRFSSSRGDNAQVSTSQRHHSSSEADTDGSKLEIEKVEVLHANNISQVTQQVSAPAPEPNYIAPPLPDEWVEYCTDDGDKYYYNSVTGHVQWKHPLAYDDGTFPHPPPSSASIQEEVAQAPYQPPFTAPAPVPELQYNQPEEPHTYTVTMTSNAYNQNPLSYYTKSKPYQSNYVPVNIPRSNQQTMLSAKKQAEILQTPPRSKGSAYAPNSSENVFHTPPSTITVPNRSSTSTLGLKRDASVSSLSGEESDVSKEKHLEIWNRFFENALAANVRRDASASRKSSSKQGVSVSGFSPLVKQRKKNSPEDWTYPLASHDYEILINKAMSPAAGDGNGDPDDSQFMIGSQAVLASTLRGDLATLEQLLVMGHNPSCVDTQIRTPLHYAARGGDVTIVSLLNDYGADVECSDIFGQTPTHIASQYGNLAVVQCLLQCGANANSKDLEGCSPMHLAAEVGHSECIQLLLEYGGNPYDMNARGRTPLDSANKTLSEPKHPNALGLRKTIAILSTVDTTEFNSFLGNKKSEEVLMYANADEEFSMASEGPDDEYYKSDSSSQVVTQDENSPPFPTKSRKTKSNRNSWRISESNSRVHSSSSFLDPRSVVQKQKSEWIERGIEKTSAYRNRYREEAPPELPKSQPSTSNQNELPRQTSSTSNQEIDHLDHPGSTDIDADTVDDSSSQQTSSGGGKYGVGQVVWGAATTLLGATMRLFGGSSQDNQDTSGISEQSTISWEHSDAPPTDGELLSKGLGFKFAPNYIPPSPRPPSIIEDDLNAYKSTLTPHTNMKEAPDEVVVAVEMARAAEKHRQTPRKSSTKPQGIVNRPPMLNINPSHSNNNQPPSSKPNGYSMGSSLPPGVSWRYVDVLNPTSQNNFVQNK